MGQGQPAPAQNASMGTGFVPNSPQVTAQMMAGPQAMAQLASLMPPGMGQLAQGQGQPGQGQPAPGQGQPAPGQGQPGQGQPSQQPGQGQPSQPGQTSPNASGGTSKAGDVADNAAVKQNPLELSPGAPEGGDGRAASENRDSDAAAKQFREDPWFAKLPPELRSAIQAKAQRRPPRSYEERLRRYFENID